MLGHWYLVASQKMVKVFTEVPSKKSFNRLKILKTLDNPLGRERNRELVRKQAGRGVRWAGGSTSLHYTHTKRHDPHEEASLQFASQVADFLKSDKRLKNFKSLTVVAEPSFMGKLKSAMGPRLGNSVVDWIQKDLIKTPQRKLMAMLLVKKELSSNLAPISIT